MGIYLVAAADDRSLPGGLAVGRDHNSQHDLPIPTRRAERIAPAIS